MVVVFYAFNFGWLWISIIVGTIKITQKSRAISAIYMKNIIIVSEIQETLALLSIGFH